MEEPGDSTSISCRPSLTVRSKDLSSSKKLKRFASFRRPPLLLVPGTAPWTETAPALRTWSVGGVPTIVADVIRGARHLAGRSSLAISKMGRCEGPPSSTISVHARRYHELFLRRTQQADQHYVCYDEQVHDSRCAYERSRGSKVTHMAQHARPRWQMMRVGQTLMQNHAFTARESGTPPDWDVRVCQDYHVSTWTKLCNELQVLGWQASAVHVLRCLVTTMMCCVVLVVVGRTWRIEDRFFPRLAHVNGLYVERNGDRRHQKSPHAARFDRCVPESCIHTNLSQH